MIDARTLSTDACIQSAKTEAKSIELLAQYDQLLNDINKNESREFHRRKEQEE